MCINRGGSISFEWPRYCAGWDLPLIQTIVSEFQLIPADVDGCSVGVSSVASPGSKILKPWRFYCSSPDLAKLLGKRRCDKTHPHLPCAGRDTYLTGFYTDKLANLMIKGIFGNASSANVAMVSARVPETMFSKFHERFYNILCNMYKRYHLKT